MSADKIDPQHYQAPGGYQAIDIIEWFGLNFARGNAVKYLLRAGNKKEEGYEAIDKEVEDLEKAGWYILREVKRLKKLQEGNK
tara:strand:- start:3925 stop:4173 length:249 start_codon:yes stop_codon:yes gene_type:complete